MPTKPIIEPAPAPEKPQAAPAGATSAAPNPAALETLNGLWADLATGRAAPTDCLSCLAEMHAAFVCDGAFG